MPGAEPTYISGDGPGILLLHDLGETPQVFEWLAKALARDGHAVDVPLLPGHGTSIESLATTSWDDWAVAAELAFDELASRTGPVVVGGVGMGATLACWVAASRPDAAGVVAINPRSMPVPQEAFDVMEAMIADGTTNVMPLGPDVSNRSQVLAYDTVPVTTLLSMFSALSDLQGHWAELECPMLVAVSLRDHRVSPSNAHWLASETGGPVEVLELERGFHVATLDVERERLEAEVRKFVARVTG
jgi:carboxylesterase